MAGIRESERTNRTSSICRYTPYVYESGRVSSCFYDTACGLKYVGIPLACKCKNCDKLAVKAAT